MIENKYIEMYQKDSWRKHKANNGATKSILIWRYCGKRTYVLYCLYSGSLQDIEIRHYCKLKTERHNYGVDDHWLAGIKRIKNK